MGSKPAQPSLQWCTLRAPSPASQRLSGSCLRARSKDAQCNLPPPFIQNLISQTYRTREKHRCQAGTRSCFPPTRLPAARDCSGSAATRQCLAQTRHPPSGEYSAFWAGKARNCLHLQMHHECDSTVARGLSQSVEVGAGCSSGPWHSGWTCCFLGAEMRDAPSPRSFARAALSASSWAVG